MTRRGSIGTALIAAMCMACVLTGCGRQDIAEELKELEADSSTGGKGGNASGVTSELAKKLGVPTGKLEYTVRMDGVQGEYEVNAEIILPDSDEVNVYEEQLLVLTEDEVKACAENLFDGGIYEQIKPYAAYTEEELKLAISDIEKVMQQEGYTYVEDEWRDEDKWDELDFYLRNYIEPTKKYEEGKFYDNQYYEAAKTDEALQGYPLYYSRIMILEGTIGGMSYQLAACEADSVNGTGVESYLWLSRSEEIKGHFYGSTAGGLDNICKLTEEVAGNSAKNYMPAMGFDDMEITKTNNLCWQRTPIKEKDNEQYVADVVADGYSFVMARAYDGLAGMNKGFGCGYLSADGNSYAEQDYYEVCVDSEGVVRVKAGPLYENTKTVSEHMELAAFDKIDKTAREAFWEEIGKADGPQDDEESVAVRGVIQISRVRLAYANLQYNGRFQLTPVWIYSSEIDNDEYPEVIINAIDGSRIYKNDYVDVNIS